MVKEITVFNKKSTSHVSGNHPLFLGEQLGAYDNVNMNHQFLFDQMEKLKEIDWAQDDVDLSQTRMDLHQCNKTLSDFMLYNLAYQWSLDSIAMSMSTLLAPFITNNEFGHCFAKIAENENLHSLTYSNIVRQCVTDPQEVFDMIYKHDEVLERSVVVSDALSDLKRVGAEFTLGIKSADECRPYIIKGMVAIFALERISFMSSFACTFALAEQGYFVGAARLVQKILMDEMVHYPCAEYVVKNMKSDPLFADIFDEYEDEIVAIIDGVVAQETNWNEYLFQDGRSVVGLNTAVLTEWTQWNSQDVYDAIGIGCTHNRIKESPLVWFDENWCDLNSQQNANMESDPTNYMVNAVSREVDIDGDDGLDGLDFE